MSLDSAAAGSHHFHGAPLRIGRFQTMSTTMTNAFLQELRTALQERLDVVADRALYERDAAAHLAKLQAASAALDHLARELSPDADPMLRHYLERQSYVKALDWLNAQPV
jgi:hypothetical protein